MTFIFNLEVGARREHMSDLIPGTKVKYRNMSMPAEVMSGPHQSPGRSRYLIRKADGNVSLVPVTDIEAVIPRAERVAGTLAVAIYGRPFTSLGGGYQRSLLSAATAAIRVADMTRGEA
jgi:hypothetical protein